MPRSAASYEEFLETALRGRCIFPEDPRDDQEAGSGSSSLYVHSSSHIQPLLMLLLGYTR